jgi:hypothetical protein
MSLLSVAHYILCSPWATFIQPAAVHSEQTLYKEFPVLLIIQIQLGFDERCPSAIEQPRHRHFNGVNEIEMFPGCACV